jgi:hypothetical protein
MNVLPEGKLRISRTLKSATMTPDVKLETHSCLVTFVDPEVDPVIRKTYGVAGLRRHKLLRITSEAFEQSVPLTQDFVSFDILGCGLRTLQRDIAFFAGEGVFVPFQRLSPADRKRRYTYRVAAAKQYLEGRTQREIAAALYQKPQAVDNFVRAFAKIVKLASSGIASAHMKTVAPLSDAMIEEYLLLFREYNTPELFMRLDLFTRTTM